MAESKQIAFRSTSIAERLGKKNLSVGLQASKELGRYFNLLNWALFTLNLTEKECLLICDALNGTLFMEFEIAPHQALLIDIQDAIAYSRLDKKWKVDKHELLLKLKNLSPIQAAAVIDAVETFWNQGEYSKSSEDMHSTVRKVFRLKDTIDYSKFHPTHAVVYQGKTIPVRYVEDGDYATEQDWEENDGMAARFCTEEGESIPTENVFVRDEDEEILSYKEADSPIKLIPLVLPKDDY